MFSDLHTEREGRREGERECVFSDLPRERVFSELTRRHALKGEQKKQNEKQKGGKAARHSGVGLRRC